MSARGRALARVLPALLVLASCGSDALGPEPPRQDLIGASAKAIDFILLFGQLKECDWALAGKQKIARSL